jgi:hypothetical protein
MVEVIFYVIPFLDETATYFTPRLTPSPLGKGRAVSFHKGEEFVNIIRGKSLG